MQSYFSHKSQGSHIAYLDELFATGDLTLHPAHNIDPADTSYQAVAQAVQSLPSHRLDEKGTTNPADRESISLKRV